MQRAPRRIFRARSATLSKIQQQHARPRTSTAIARGREREQSTAQNRAAARRIHIQLHAHSPPQQYAYKTTCARRSGFTIQNCTRSRHAGTKHHTTKNIIRSPRNCSAPPQSRRREEREKDCLKVRGRPRQGQCAERKERGSAIEERHL
jgi:hypothetical protein